MYVYAVLGFVGISQALQVPLPATDIPAIQQAPAGAWKALNQSVNGRLYLGLPVGLPCFDNYNGVAKSVNETACKVVTKNKDSMEFWTSAMTGYAQGNWGVCQSIGSGCPISAFGRPVQANAPCRSGNLPSYFVDVRRPQDVTAALEFAAKHRVPIVVKNSGHDYKGRSAGANSLGLWLNNYRPKPTFTAKFIPEGCKEPVGDVVTIGTGEPFDGLYEFAGKQNVTVIGGSSRSVRPAGGWITGGGHSALSPVYGLGVDNVHQIRVVLPSGKYVTANRCQNQDIFFAVRGGGGATFGVNMEMSIHAHPRADVQWVNLQFRSLSMAQQQQLLAILARNANSWFEQGWGGYAIPVGKDEKGPFAVRLMNPRLTRSQAILSLADLFLFARGVGVSPTVTTYSSFWDLYKNNIRDSLANTGNFGLAEASRLVPRSNLDGLANQKKVVSTITNAAKSTYQVILLFVTPGGKIHSPNSSVTPAWREARWHVIYVSAWDQANTTPSQVLNNFRTLSNLMDPLRKFTPGGGAYLNEADTYEPDPKGAYWGPTNYNRLLAIKNKYDRKRVMQVYGGIGSDKNAPMYECYPRLSKSTWDEDLSQEL